MEKNLALKRTHCVRNLSSVFIKALNGHATQALRVWPDGNIPTCDDETRKDNRIGENILPTTPGLDVRDFIE